MAAQDQQVIWARCDDPAHLDQVAAIADLLLEDGDNVRFLCSLPNPTGLDAIKTPEGQKETRKFLLAHKPAAMLWIGGVIDPGALTPCYDVKLPVIVLEGSDRMLARVLGSWMPNRARATLSRLHAVYAPSDRIKREFMAAGTPPEVITIAGSISEASTVLPYREDDRVDFAASVGTRPVWMAAGATPRDVMMLCDAHKDAVRLAHRLLLIIAPQKSEDGPEIAAMCDAAGWITARRSQGDDPHEAVQIYLADDKDGLGLWYRCAPICFLAGTFGEGARDDPFHAAALGSVLIHGRAYGPYRARFEQLMSANASLALSHPDDLGGAVSRLLSVDKAAAMANAGWDVTSQGVGTAVSVVTQLQALLDRVDS